MSRIIHQPAEQMMAGHAIGILVLKTGYPLLPGNVANATTFGFPVRYKVVDVASPQLIAGDPTVFEPVRRAAEELVADGCHVIVGACGYFGRLQQQLAAALPVPVFLSSLSQVPMILSSLRPDDSLGVLCARGAAFDDALLDAVGVHDRAQLVIAGLEHSPAFRAAILEDQGWMDTDAVEAEVINTATQLAGSDPSVRAILLECSDLPPYARSIRDATGLPVWDYVSLIEWARAGIVKKRFDGFI